MSARILIVDDEEIVIRSCKRILAGGGHSVDSASNGFDGLRMVDENPYDIVVLDIMMPKMDGLEVLQQIKERHPEVDVIMITGLSQIQTAVKAMKLGAFDYLPKPFDPDELEHVVARALERRRLLQENRNLKTRSAPNTGSRTSSAPARRCRSVFGLIAKCAPTNSTVLITGESGTGKEMIARAIHYNSLRQRPAVRHGGLQHAVREPAGERAVRPRQGLVHRRGRQQARHVRGRRTSGTLFLDEFGNIPLDTQAKLLRVIQEREFRPVGSTTVQTTNVRLVAATNKDLMAMVADGTFREDLYYRVAVFPIHAPALRERRDDIPALAFHFLKRICGELDCGKRCPRSPKPR
jgi:DNA-binding NtrC family response regulator